MHGITLRIVSPTRPHEAAVIIDPNLEEAYLLATSLAHHPATST